MAWRALGLTAVGGVVSAVTLVSTSAGAVPTSLASIVDPGDRQTVARLGELADEQRELGARVRASEVKMSETQRRMRVIHADIVAEVHANRSRLDAILFLLRMMMLGLGLGIVAVVAAWSSLSRRLVDGSSVRSVSSRVRVADLVGDPARTGSGRRSGA